MTLEERIEREAEALYREAPDAHDSPSLNDSPDRELYVRAAQAVVLLDDSEPEHRCDWCGRVRPCEPARAGRGFLWICADCERKAVEDGRPVYKSGFELLAEIGRLIERVRVAERERDEVLEDCRNMLLDAARERDEALQMKPWSRKEIERYKRERDEARAKYDQALKKTEDALAKVQRERDEARELAERAIDPSDMQGVTMERNMLRDQLAVVERERDEALVALKSTDSWMWNKVVHGRYGPVNEAKP